MNNYTLTYRKGRSQEIYIEEISDNKDQNKLLYFKQEYDDAIRLIKEIIILQGIGADDDKGDDNENGKKNKRDIKKYGCNNRILFAGQRGCGKTSVMQSLADYLSKYKIKIEKDDDKKDDDKIRCYCLPMVDPSHFDNNNNILLTVITRMFSEAKKKMETNNDKDESAEREDLLKQFEKVFKSLDSIKSELSSYTLESLNRKSDAEDLKDKMNILVNKFLKYVVGNKEARLILLIDDIDMSVSYAPEMLEQLRKYLELDNLIILMSANLGQLSNEMREKYSSAFQYTLKDSNQALSIDVEDLATKYLLKLFPTSRRINVERHVTQLLETDLVIKEFGKDDIKDEFQRVILSMIWSKTRLLFIPKDSKNTLHPIIPTNLRDLAQFLDMLTSLEKVGSVYEYKDEKDNKTIKESRLFASKKDYDLCEHNLQVFKNYFMKTWIPNHLKVDEELVFHNIPADITEINKHLINSINIIGTKHKDDLMSREVGLDIIERNAEGVYIDRDIYTMVSPNDPKFVKANKISDIFNQPSNYSYGDLLLMIDKYETYFESEEHRKFTDAIKIYYSILLFETMFFKSDAVVFNLYERTATNISEELKSIINRHTVEGVITNGDLKQIDEIDKKLENGNTQKSDKDELISNRISCLANFVKTALQSDDSCYDEDKELIKKYMPDFPSQIIPIQRLIGGNVYYPNYFEIITDKNFNQKGPSFDAKRAFYHKIKVDDKGDEIDNIQYPFFAVLYYGDIRPDRYEKDHIYDTKFQTNSEVDRIHYVTFDILSILNNMLNPWQTIGRLDASDKKVELFEKWSTHISDWDSINIVGEKTIPNAILPFYSVDIMLQYLSKSYSASKVIGQKDNNDYKEEKDLIKKGKAMFIPTGEDANNTFLGLLIPLYKEQCIDLLKNSTIDESTVDAIVSAIENGLYNQAKLDKNNHKIINGFNKRIDIINSYYKQHNKENSVFAECEKSIKKCITAATDKDGNLKSILIKNLEIIKNSYDGYRDYISLKDNKIYPENVQELYLDYVVSLIMASYQGNKKDRDGLIKDLHKFTTISEIYKHLVEVLWENAIMEMLIRADIQKGVRKPESVGRYYGLLWKETKELLTNITVSNIDPEGIYSQLCQEAGTTFIYNDFELNTILDALS